MTDFLIPDMGPQFFTQVPNAALDKVVESGGPSFTSLLAYYLLSLRKSLPEDLWFSFTQHATKTLGVKQSSYDAAMKRLEEWGYLTRSRVKGVWESRWVMNPEEEPQEDTTLVSQGMVEDPPLSHKAPPPLSHKGHAYKPDHEEYERLHAGETEVSPPPDGLKVSGERLERQVQDVYSFYREFVGGWLGTATPSQPSKRDREKLESALQEFTPDDLKDTLRGFKLESERDSYREDYANITHIVKSDNISKYTPFVRKEQRKKMEQEARQEKERQDSPYLSAHSILAGDSTGGREPVQREKPRKKVKNTTSPETLQKMGELLG